jgi:hypothetical protein
MKREPHYYRTPLRSRQDIAAYLDSVGGYDGHHGRSYFSFNVKCYGANLDFDHLIEVYRQSGYYGMNETWLDNPEWLEQARRRYAEVEKHLFDWGVEEAGRLVTDSGTYSRLYDGTKVDAEYIWMGRSGGYIGIGRFEGLDFAAGHARDYWHEAFRGNPRRQGTAAWHDWERTFPTISYATLRRLYALVVMLAHDLTPEIASLEVESQTAFQFVENACQGIPRYDSIQLRLPLAG